MFYCETCEGNCPHFLKCADCWWFSAIQTQMLCWGHIFILNEEKKQPFLSVKHSNLWKNLKKRCLIRTQQHTLELSVSLRWTWSALFWLAFSLSNDTMTPLAPSRQMERTAESFLIAANCSSELLSQCLICAFYTFVALRHFSFFCLLSWMNHSSGFLTTNVSYSS